MLLRIVLLSLILTGCEPFTVLPAPSATPATAAPAAAPRPASSPLPKPAFSETPEYFKGLSGWAGSFKVSLNYANQLPQYSYQEKFIADGVVRMVDETANGGFLSWPIPSKSDNWQASIISSSELSDTRTGAAIQRNCKFNGNKDMDLGLSITAGSYRLAGRLSGVSTVCEGGGPAQTLPTLALSDNNRYWEINFPLPASGTNLKGSHTIELDGKLLDYSWDLNPLPN